MLLWQSADRGQRCKNTVSQGPLNGGVSNSGGFPIWTCPSFLLFCPFSSLLGLSRFFRDFPDLLGDGPGIFPISPFPLSRPIKITLPARNFPKKSGKSLPGPPAPAPSESLEKVSKKSFRDLFETFSRLSISRLFPNYQEVLGPEGPRDPCKWSERRDPLQESSGPSGPKSPPKCPRECPRKAGCAWKCLRECSRDRPKMCPKSDLKVSKKTLFGHF